MSFLLRRIAFEREHKEGYKIYSTAWVMEDKRLKPGLKIIFKDDDNELVWTIISIGKTAKPEQILGLQRIKSPSVYRS